MYSLPIVLLVPQKMPPHQNAKASLPYKTIKSLKQILSAFAYYVNKKDTLETANSLYYITLEIKTDCAVISLLFNQK